LKSGFGLPGLGLSGLGLCSGLTTGLPAAGRSIEGLFPAGLEGFLSAGLISGLGLLSGLVTDFAC
jgi:hypothetical protein